MAQPIDGWGLYESVNITNPSVPARFAQIASGGFKLVLCYDVLNGHASDLLHYADLAAAAGLRLIWALNNPAIWRDNTIGTTYPALSSDAGSTTESGFTTYVVNLVKNHPATWGYYIGDELDTPDHAAVLIHATTIHAADPTHPRLIIDSAAGAYPSYATSGSVYHDVAEVIGSDYYPIGSGLPVATTTPYAINVQAYANTYGLASAMVLGAHSAATYGGPANSPYPTYTDMRTQRDDVLANMTPRIIMWYSFFDILKSKFPNTQWADLVAAVFGGNTTPGTWVTRTLSGAYLMPPSPALLPPPASPIQNVSTSRFGIGTYQVLGNASVTVGSGIPLQSFSFMLDNPYAGLYGGTSGFLVDTRIKQPQSSAYTPAPEIGLDSTGLVVVRGYPVITWQYTSMRPDDWYYLKFLHLSSARYTPPGQQYLVMLQYPAQDGLNTPTQVLAYMDPPTFSNRDVGAFYGVTLTFRYVGQSTLTSRSMPVLVLT